MCSLDGFSRRKQSSISGLIPLPRKTSRHEFSTGLWNGNSSIGIKLRTRVTVTSPLEFSKATNSSRDPNEFVKRQGKRPFSWPFVVYESFSSAAITPSLSDNQRCVIITCSMPVCPFRVRMYWPSLIVRMLPVPSNDPLAARSSEVDMPMQKRAYRDRATLERASNEAFAMTHTSQMIQVVSREPVISWLPLSSSARQSTLSMCWVANHDTVVQLVIHDKSFAIRRNPIEHVVPVWTRVKINVNAFPIPKQKLKFKNE